MATNPPARAPVKASVERTRKPASGNGLLTKHIDEAYTTIYDHFHAGLPAVEAPAAQLPEFASSCLVAHYALNRRRTK